MIKNLVRESGVCPHMPAEELILVGGLVGTGVDQGAGTASRDHDQRHVRMPRLQHRWMQVGCRSARRREYGRRRTRSLGEPERQEARGALIDPDMQPQEPNPVSLETLIRQWGTSRAGSKYHVTDTAVDQLFNDHPRARRGITHRPAP